MYYFRFIWTISWISKAQNANARGVSYCTVIFIYRIHNLSRTDVECQWRVKKTVVTVQTASQMFPLPENKKDYSPLSWEPRNEDREWFYHQLRQYGKFTGVCWRLCREPEPAAQLPLKTIEEIIFSESFLGEQTSLGQLEYFIRNVKVGEDTAKEVSALTTWQRDNPAWHLARKGWLTAHNFGAVLKAKQVTQALTTCLLGDYDLSRVRTIAWFVLPWNSVRPIPVLQRGCFQGRRTSMVELPLQGTAGMIAWVTPGPN